MQDNFRYLYIFKTEYNHFISKQKISDRRVICTTFPTYNIIKGAFQYITGCKIDYEFVNFLK